MRDRGFGAGRSAVLSPRYVPLPAGGRLATVLSGGVRAGGAGQDSRPGTGKKRIEVSEADAAHFACNAVNIGQKVILNHASDELQVRLKGAGFMPIQTELQSS